MKRAPFVVRNFLMPFFLLFIACEEDVVVETQCDISSFRTELPGLGEGDLGADGQWFSCPSSISIPTDAVPYRDPQFILDFNNYIRGLAVSWIEQDCLSCCDHGSDMTQCIEADCVTDSGATIYYRYEESFFPGEEQYTSDRIAWRETIEVTPPAGAETWERLEIQLDMTSTDTAGSDDLYGITGIFDVSWTGTIRPEWPADFRVSSAFADRISDIYDWTTGEWRHAQCDLAIYAAGETLIEEGFGHEVEIGTDVLEVKQNSNSSKLYGWINEECVGEVSEVSWEIIGPC